MKKQIIIATLALGAFVIGTNNIQAQTATTTVNITLNDVISIDAGSIAIGGAVDFNYITAEDYNTSKTAIVPTSLIVTSTKNFDVKVKADGANFTNGSNNIPVNVLIIKAATGGSMAGTQNSIVLSDSDQVLIANAPLGSALTLNLDYTIPATKSSSSDILGKPAGTYTQTVTYTATAL
ncbi:peptidoglycan-binding protein LysM [Bizionia argentinensis JUB59]|uniref:Peptidoglycan-binding protein LysM n=1 Tax=Bizionia argentinensis JUB59 TaxID=1046627 RepID=G2EAH4_9FLAO|nr:hypothetical protein [Bizionia argentinensis]EGV44533.1 peptidoglycan-binding protein LysM [Bizionia argentinensis JUB59]